MSNGTNNTTDISEFLADHINTTVEGEGPGTGPVQVVALMHHGATETEVRSMEPKSPNWGDPYKMAEILDARAAQYAKGIVGGGAQQFTIVIARNGGKACATFPFIRVGAPNFTGSGGGFATEPATATGAMQQSMRLHEIQAQGAFALTQGLVSTMKGLLDSTVNRLDTTEKRSDERWLALQNLLLEWQKQSMNSQMRALLIEGGRKLLPLLPAGIATLTGAELPQQVIDDSLTDTLVENFEPAKLQEMLGTFAQASPEAGPFVGVLADHLVRAQRRKAARDAETHRLTSGAPTSFANAEADAAGAAYRALSNRQDQPSPAAKRLVQATQQPPTNGNGHAPAPVATPSPQPASANDDTAVIEAFFARLGPTAEVMFGMMDDKDPDLAKRLRARHAEWTAKIAGGT